ncbi:MAG: CDP-glycerol glycerophosphotransferase family protein, partial [Microbacterium sp.]
VVDLRRQPRFLQLGAGTVFLLLADLRRFGLVFDEQIRPNFEDAALITEYLLRLDEPTIGLIPGAVYYYRQREDGTSLVQTSSKDPRKYTTVLERGYLRILETARTRHGQVPRWVQFLILYDLQWVLKEDQQIHSSTSALSRATTERFHELLIDVLAYFDANEILRYNVTHLPMRIRVALYATMTGAVPPHLDTHITKIDRDRGMAQIRYFTATADDRETILADGVVVEPLHHKTRAIRYLGRTLVYERIVWVSNRHDLEVVVGSGLEPDRLRFAAMGQPIYTATSHRLGAPPAAPASTPAEPESRSSRASRRIRDLPNAVRRRGSTLHTRVVRRFAESAFARRRYRDAWVLTDRDSMARDNAESLYRYLQREQPHVNAWFVINRSAPDYSRLRKEGFRLVPYRSRRHIALMRNAKHLISSQVDHYVVSPYDQRRFGRGAWKYTFLQHGVTKDDLSNWLEHKSIDLLLTSTPAEYRSFTVDESGYHLTDREVALTGMPRNDETLAKRNAIPASERNLLLIMPTWREGLLTAVNGQTNARDLLPEFMDSQYARSWFGLLGSAGLHEVAKKHNLTIAFLPHPNLDGLVPDSLVPDGVDLLSYSTHDVKDLLAAAHISITDYSSLAFESGFIGVPVVYFQFDAATFHDGTQPYRKGYFDYDQDGFGPVAETGDAVVDAVRELLESEDAGARFARRMAETFPLRDDRASERTYHQLLTIGGDAVPEA